MLPSYRLNISGPKLASASEAFFLCQCSAPTWSRAQLQCFAHFVSRDDFLTKLANQNFYAWGEEGVLTVTDIHSDAV
jgi:hypothetical protein